MLVKIPLPPPLGKEGHEPPVSVYVVGCLLLLITFVTLRQNFLSIKPTCSSLSDCQHLKMVRHYSDENIPANALAPELAKIVLITLATSILMSVSILIFNYKKLI